MQQPQQWTSAAPCVGREAELSRLAELYAVAREHGERLALVEGPSGVGKSRILQEFRGRVRLEGGVVLDGRCEPGRAFGPFADIVDRALRFLSEVGAAPSIDLADLGCRGGCHRFWYQHGSEPSAPTRAESQATDRGSSPPPPMQEVEAIERRLRFFDAIAGLLRDTALVRPPVILLHDLERADLGTLQLLSFLLEGAGPFNDGVAPAHSIKALFVASVRIGEDLESARLQGLRLHPAAVSVPVGTLDADGVRALLTSPETVARVLARTGGMPEAIDLLLDSEPVTAETRLVRRLAALPPAARALVEALAVLERPADIDTLTRVAGVHADVHARTEFGRAELLARTIIDGRILFSFVRDMDRERTYAGLSDDKRRELHGRSIDTATNPENAARHALRAGDLDRAVPLALDAASSIAARHAHGEAAEFLEAIVNAGTSLGRQVPVAIRAHLADLYRLAADYKRALVHARSVWEETPADTSAARRVGDLLTLAGELDTATQVLEDAHRLAASSDDPTAVVDVETLLAEVYFQRAAYDGARSWAERALQAAEALGDVLLAIHARNTLGKLAITQKNAAAAARYFEENRQVASTAGLGHQEAQALTNLGIAFLRKQDLAAAETCFARAIDVAAGASDTRDRAIATENLAVLAHLRRDYQRAQFYYHEAVALLKRLGNRAFLANAANNLGELYLSLGDRKRARTMCEFAAHVGGSAVPPSLVGVGLILRGRIEASEGHTTAARVAFEGAVSTFERLGAVLATSAKLELARVALADGDVSAARRILASLPTDDDSPKHAAEVAIVAVDVERAAGGDSLALARRAAEAAERAADPELLLPALVRLARALADRNELAAASRALERAQEIEAVLSANVPPDSLAMWSERPARIELAAIEAQIASSAGALRAGDSSYPSLSGILSPAVGRSTRPSSTPPRPREQHRAQWRQRYPDIVGCTPAVSTIMALLDKAAPSDCLVLIRGESGTGKELIAEALHRNSPRRDRPLVKVNCAALVETLLLSELFGHERGAFTGAQARKKGRFEIADGGTLFLDEIGDISQKTQVALLRVLQEREFERVGGTQPIKVDVRIIAATHRDLEQMVRDGTFREDLYYRLRGVTVDMPPLRRRLDDLGELCDHLLSRIARERAEAPKVLSPEALTLLASHRWPGNVRELENVLRSATLFADSPVLFSEDFAAFASTFKPADPEPEMAIAPASAGVGDANADEVDLVYRRVRKGDVSLFDMKKELERECIVRALAETRGNITRAAQLLGMKRPRLSQLVKQYGLTAGGDS